MRRALAIAAVLVVLSACPARPHNKSSPGGVPVVVYVATADIPQYTTGTVIVARHMVGLETVARPQVKPGALTSLQQLTNVAAARTIPKGSQLTASSFMPVSVPASPSPKRPK